MFLQGSRVNQHHHNQNHSWIYRAFPHLKSAERGYRNRTHFSGAIVHSKD